MTYIPLTYFSTRSEVDHIRNTLEDVQMFYEMYASKPGNINDDLMETRIDDCDHAQNIIRNLESDEMIPLLQEYTANKRNELSHKTGTRKSDSAIHTARAIDQVIDSKVWTDTDYFD